VHVDRARKAHDPVDDGTSCELRPARALTRADHELSRVLGTREVDQRGSHVAADHFVVLAAQLFEQLAMLCDRLAVAARKAIFAENVDTDEIAVLTLRDPRCPPNQRVSAGCTRDRDNDPFARFPRLLDAVTFAVVLQPLVDLVGDPQQRELA
jgi:hypothetical protein